MHRQWSSAGSSPERAGSDTGGPRPTAATRVPRAVWRLCRVALHLLHGMGVVWLGWAALCPAQRQQRIAWWSAKLLRLLGVRLDAGGPLPSQGTLLVANHLSWLDIVAIHALCPGARFVSKADVRHWPLLGRLVAAADTLFVARESRRDARRVVQQMAQALQAGDTVAVFPEGTTGNGLALLPFHGNLLQAAIDTCTPIQPLALRYRDAERQSIPAAVWTGETTLLRSLWLIANAESLCVGLQVLPVQAGPHEERRALAGRLRQAIADAVA
jgi:1-acyl-sn-glycerol-3-phosphate acyltransferase